MKHKFGRLFLACIAIIFITVCSAGCIDDVTTYTEVVEEPGYVMYISADILTSEMSMEIYMENDWLSVNDWEFLCESMLIEMVDVAKKEGLEFSEGYIYTSINNVGYTASYTPSKGISYIAGSTKVCPIEIPPHEN